MQACSHCVNHAVGLNTQRQPTAHRPRQPAAGSPPVGRAHCAPPPTPSTHSTNAPRPRDLRAAYSHKKQATPAKSTRPRAKTPRSYAAAKIIVSLNLYCGTARVGGFDSRTARRLSWLLRRLVTCRRRGAAGAPAWPLPRVWPCAVGRPRT
eukprot:217628-Chlamydomonas_euryale.AAC.1